MRATSGYVLLIQLCLQPAPAQNSLNASQDLVRLGIASSNMLPNTPELDSSPLFVRAVAYAKSHDVTLLTVDRGSYYFLTSQSPVAHSMLAQVDGMTIDFQGSDLLLGQPSAGGVWLQRSKNAVLQNFAIDYLRLPFTQLRVVSIDPVKREVQYQVEPGWPDAAAFNPAGISSAEASGYFFFIFRSGHPAPDLSRMEAQQPFGADRFTILDDGLPWTRADVLKRIRPGDVVALTARGGNDPVRADACDGCVLRNIRIYSAYGWGFQVVNSRSTLVEHVYTMPKPGTDRLISTNADGITLSQPGPDNIYRLNRAIRTLDDGLSPHSLLFGTVTGQTARQVRIERQFNLGVTNGSPVEFQRSDGAVLGSAVVVSQNPSAPSASGALVTVDLDRDLPVNVTGAVVYTTDPDQRGANTLIERNTVQDQVFARGITLWGLMNSTVQGNYVWRAAWDGILGTHRLDPADWMSPPLVNLGITRNVIDGADSLYGWGLNDKMAGITIQGAQLNFQPMTASPNANIQIVSNFIADPGRSAVRVESTAGGAVTGNYFLNPNNQPSLEGYAQDILQPYVTQFRQPIVVSNSQSVSAEDNAVDKTSARAYVTDTVFFRLAAYAPGMTIRLNGYNIGSSAAAAVTLSDADSNVQPASIQARSAHSLDIEIPPSAALGGAWLTATTGGTTYLATLFIDSVDNIPTVNGCAYWIGPAGNTLPGAGGTVPVLVVTHDGCAYSAVPSGAFVSYNSPEGSGTAVLQARVAANPGLQRTVTIDVAGYQIPLTQKGIVNYALFARSTSSASLDAARTPDKAVDGNIQTLWSAGVAPPGWIEVQLAADAVVGSVRVTVRVGIAGTVQTVRVSARQGDGSLRQLKEFTVRANDFDVVSLALDAPVSGARAIRIETTQ